MYQLARRASASSPAELVASALSKPQTYRAAVVYLLSAVATLALHVIAAYFIEPTARGEPNLGLFVKSRCVKRTNDYTFIYQVVLGNTRITSMVVSSSLSLPKQRRHWHIASALSCLTDLLSVGHLLRYVHSFLVPCVASNGLTGAKSEKDAVRCCRLHQGQGHCNHICNARRASRCYRLFFCSTDATGVISTSVLPLASPTFHGSLSPGNMEGLLSVSPRPVVVQGMVPGMHDDLSLGAVQHLIRNLHPSGDLYSPASFRIPF